MKENIVTEEEIEPGLLFFGKVIQGWSILGGTRDISTTVDGTRYEPVIVIFNDDSKVEYLLKRNPK